MVKPKAKKASAPAAPKARTSEETNEEVKVECTGEDCWTPGGFLAVGDVTFLRRGFAEKCQAEGKVKIL